MNLLINACDAVGEQGHITITTRPTADGVRLSFEDDGYVSDADAAEMDYDEVLSGMQADTAASNESRMEQGYGSIELIGWAEDPHYDPESHKLYWAKELRFGDAEVNTLNYNIFIPSVI